MVTGAQKARSWHLWVVLW